MYILSQCKEIDEYLYLIIKNLFDVDSYLTDSVEEVYNQLMNYINDGITQDKVSVKILKKLLDFKYDSAKKIVKYFKNYTLGILTSSSFKNSLPLQVIELIPTDIPLTITLNFTNIYYEILDSEYLIQMQNEYITNINERRENIIKEINKFKFERSIQIGKLGQGMKSSDLASAIVEYNVLNATLSKINNDFYFDLSDSKKEKAYNLLANNNLKNLLKTIKAKYIQSYNNVQSNINYGVYINVDLSKFQNKLNELKSFDSINDNFNQFTIIKEELESKILDLFENFTINVKNNYDKQTFLNNTIKSVNLNLRRLDNDIQIESIQSIIDQIEIKFTNFTKVLSNLENLTSISSKLTQINNAITVQLISLNNTLESYLSYAKFYLKRESALTNYENNMTKIYLQVEQSLNNYLNSQSIIIEKIYESLSLYKSIFDDEIKSELIQKINNIIKDYSKALIKQYLKDSYDSKSKNFDEKRIKDLTVLDYIMRLL